jgi:uncharacterized protein YjdB
MARESLPLEVLVHIRDVGDRSYRERKWAGTKGESRRLEGFQIRILPPVPDVGLRYKAHVEGIGDTDWQYSYCEQTVDAFRCCAYAGTRGESLRVEGFQIECTGSARDNYAVVYQAHVDGLGDIGPLRDSEFCGTRGESRRIEAVRVRVTPRG